MNEFIPPNSIFREMPGLDNFPKDEIGREITMLVFDHPDQSKESLVKNIKIKPNIENLGDGLFTIKTPDSSESKGEWFELEK